MVHATVLGSALTFGIIALFGPSHEAEANRATEVDLPATEVAALDRGASQAITEALAIPPIADESPALQPTPAAAQTSPGPWKSVTVRSGDTLSSIFSKLGLPTKAWYGAVKAGGPAKRLQNLRPGQELRLWVEGKDGERTLSALHYIIDHTKRLEIAREGDGFAAKLVESTVESRSTYAHAVIENSLYEAGQKAGLSDNLIMQLVNIFGWDIDFALDIRSGDSLTVLYEEAFLAGEKLRDGNILAAEFINNGRTYRAVRYTDPKGHTDYYSQDGHSMRKAFIRSPVDFRRISSRFQRERWHPVLGKKRPHRGVDYAAAVGTPIKAAGDGKIMHRGWKGGYGRTIIIQHGGKYSTLYAHMSSYRRGLRAGSRVKQGQVIGYVGNSGLATGPHLHYEFRVNGAHRNPLTVKLPKAEPIRKAYREDFQQKSSKMLAQLDVLRKTIVTLNDTPL